MYCFIMAVCCTIAMDKLCKDYADKNGKEKRNCEKITNMPIAHVCVGSGQNEEHNNILHVKMSNHQHFYCFMTISKSVMDSIFFGFPSRTDPDRLQWHRICVLGDLHLFYVTDTADDNTGIAIGDMFSRNSDVLRRCIQI